MYIYIYIYTYTYTNIHAYTYTRAPHRPFLTNSTLEYDYLVFMGDIRTAANSLSQYSAVTSCCVIIFVFRLVKGLHFQEQVGLITRTLCDAVCVCVCVCACVRVCVCL